MELNKTYIGDCMELSKDVPDNYVDLVVTSPPYADTVSYGDNVNIFSPENYPKWILPLFKEANRFLKPTGSFILNINDRIIKGERSIYVLETAIKVAKESGLKLYDRYIWYKKNGLPMGGDRRLNDRIEYIFHFVRDVKNFKSNIDDVRVPYAASSLIRSKGKVKTQKTAKSSGIAEFGKDKDMNINPLGSKPHGVFRFDNAGVLKGADHPAPFHPDLPKWFIRWLTDEDDIVLDPFMGSGTTADVALKLNRNFIGMELNKEYYDMSEEILKKSRRVKSTMEKAKEFFDFGNVE
jgi:DNA modification methylase